MEKITIIQDSSGKDVVVIDRGNNEFTSMLKSTYDAQQEAIANFVLPTLPEAPTE